MKTRKELFECDACNVHGFTLARMKLHNKTEEHIKLACSGMYVPKPQHTPSQVRQAHDLAVELGHLNKNISSLIDLYAAAPELLEVCKAALNTLEGLAGNYAVTDRLMQAIDRAEGRSEKGE